MGLATSGRPSLATCSVAAAATSQLPCKRGWLGVERALHPGLCDPGVPATAKLLDLSFAKLWDFNLNIIYCLLALLLYVLDFDTIISYLLSFVAFASYVLDKCNLVDILTPVFLVAIYLNQPYGIRKKIICLAILLVTMHQPPSGSGTVPLQEYRRDIPPGWMPGNPSYTLKEYLEKLRLWY